MISIYAISCKLSCLPKHGQILSDYAEIDKTTYRKNR